MTAAHPDPLAWRRRLQERLRLPEKTVEMPLEQAGGAVLGADLTAGEDLPAVRIAAMDGFAVRRADLAVGGTTLPVAAELPARPGAVGPHRAGTATRIMTGAPVPEGADAVIEVEATDADPFGPAPRSVRVHVEALPDVDRHIRRPGEEIARGAEIARAGERIGAGLVGLAAALGLRTLPVRRPPRVAVVVTGDELVGDPEAPAGPESGAGPGAGSGPESGSGPENGAPATGAVRESNGTMLVAALEADGVRARHLRSGDEPAQLRAVLEEAADGSDLVLTTGGIGHGAFDVVKLLLGPQGTDSSEFAHLALRPGGPQGAGRLPDGTPVVHLPGTPVGALVGHHLFVRPLLPAGGGALRRVRLEAGEWKRPLRGAPGTVHALPALLGRDVEGWETARPVPGRRLAPYGRAEAIVLLTVPDRPTAPSGPGRPGDRAAGTIGDAEGRHGVEDALALTL